ncbi:MAG: sugar transferase [Bryobacterales bacterium]|nr:sugar transferase [Bryobacterales bacterium]
MQVVLGKGELKLPRSASGDSSPSLASKAGWILLRAVEILVASIALLLTFPILILVALYIKWDSPGPAIFRQTRIGKDLQPFSFYKFRTLYADARERFPELYRYEYTPQELDELQFKTEEDPRVTPAGRWLRRTTIDELPNFWNLLKGDVAIVGPRPEIPEMVKYHAPEHMIKFSVRPGITGLAQICGRGRLKFHQTNHFDQQYVLTRSFGLDCRIVLQTVKKVVRLDGAF